ncbi:hypothetical protein XENTR_v10024764 [Xenopus tropicalis]|nr:hypothetical protein XENTR_v10024764 [Xenopus tropicalis]
MQSPTDPVRQGVELLPAAPTDEPKAPTNEPPLRPLCALCRIQQRLLCALGLKEGAGSAIGQSHRTTAASDTKLSQSGAGDLGRRWLLLICLWVWDCNGFRAGDAAALGPDTWLSAGKQWGTCINPTGFSANLNPHCQLYVQVPLWAQYSNFVPNRREGAALRLDHEG